MSEPVSRAAMSFMVECAARGWRDAPVQEWLESRLAAIEEEARADAAAQTAVAVEALEDVLSEYRRNGRLSDETLRAAEHALLWDKASAEAFKKQVAEEAVAAATLRIRNDAETAAIQAAADLGLIRDFTSAIYAVRARLNERDEARNILNDRDSDGS